MMHQFLLMAFVITMVFLPFIFCQHEMDKKK